MIIIVKSSGMLWCESRRQKRKTKQIFAVDTYIHITVLSMAISALKIVDLLVLEVSGQMWIQTTGHDVSKVQETHWEKEKLGSFKFSSFTK